MIRVAEGHVNFNYSVERETFVFGKKTKKNERERKTSRGEMEVKSS